MSSARVSRLFDKFFSSNFCGATDARCPRGAQRLCRPRRAPSGGRRMARQRHSGGGGPRAHLRLGHELGELDGLPVHGREHATVGTRITTPTSGQRRAGTRAKAAEIAGGTTRVQRFDGADAEARRRSLGEGIFGARAFDRGAAADEARRADRCRRRRAARATAPPSPSGRRGLAQLRGASSRSRRRRSRTSTTAASSRSSRRSSSRIPPAPRTSRGRRGRHKRRPDLRRRRILRRRERMAAVPRERPCTLRELPLTPPPSSAAPPRPPAPPPSTPDTGVRRPRARTRRQRRRLGRLLRVRAHRDARARAVRAHQGVGAAAETLPSEMCCFCGGARSRERACGVGRHRRRRRRRRRRCSPPNDDGDRRSGDVSKPLIFPRAGTGARAVWVIKDFLLPDSAGRFFRALHSSLSGRAAARRRSCGAPARSCRHDRRRRRRGLRRRGRAAAPPPP